MKLYFAPGACSLSPHIVLREAGAKFDLEQVDLREKKTKKGDDYWTINPKGQVPLLELDDGQMISEGPAIVQYVADKNPGAGIIPAAGSIDRYHLQGWLTHIGTELHKTYGPMFRPTTPDEYKKISKETLANKYKNIDKMLEGKQYLMGDKFTVADAYLYTVTRWAPRVEFDLSPFPNAFPYVDQYVPLRWRVMAPTKKRPPYPRGCDGADKPEHNLVHHCFASERRRHWAQTEDALAGTWQAAFLGKAEPRTARHQVRRPCADG